MRTYIEFSTASTVAATASQSMPVLGNTVEVFSGLNGKWVSMKATGSTTVYITPGDGS